MPARLTKGSEVRIEFLDHVEDGHKALACVVYGRVHKVGRKAIVVASWDYAKPRYQFDDPNVKHFTILRSTIKSVTHLPPCTES
jgi:hypothetical protein